MNTRIYADNAATTHIDDEAFNAMLPWLRNEYGNASQPYSFSRPAKRALARARETIANCIGADPAEIYFTSGGSESDNWAIKGVCRNKENSCVVTSEIEHHAIINTCKSIQKNGAQVNFLPVNDKGIILPSILSEGLKKDTNIVSIMFANNEIGTIEPISELVEIAHKKGVLFHTDAVQAVGHIPIDVKRIGVDMLSASAHKFNGPKGIGFLYVKKGTHIAPIIDGGNQENGLRAGTENIASIVGMAEALKNNIEDMDRNTKLLHTLEQNFIDVLKRAEVDFLYNGEKHNRIPGNVNISIRNISGEAMLHRLDLMGICISTGAACNSTTTTISHVIKAINVPSYYSKGTIRISFGKFNSIDDGKTVADAIIKVLGEKEKKPSIR